MDVCNKMVGKLYGIGVGPGDSELLTVKAVRLLQEADVIAVPDIGHGRQTAQGIIELYIEEKELLNCSTPMVRDRAAADASYDRIADQVCERLAAGKTVAYATLGDPTVYSTYVRIHQRVVARGFEAEIVPGVTSFCAVAARLGMALCEGAERLTIVPTSTTLGAKGLPSDLPTSTVYMKVGRDMGRLSAFLRERGEFDRAAAVANCGLLDEVVYENLSEAEGECAYFSTVIVPCERMHSDRAAEDGAKGEDNA